MSEEKVLTLRGKRAVWAPASAGVGGTTVEVYADMSAFPPKYTSNMTGADILKAAANGPIVGVLTNGTEKMVLDYVGSFLKDSSDTPYAAFGSIIYSESAGKLAKMYYLVPSDGKTIEQFSYVFEKADTSS